MNSYFINYHDIDKDIIGKCKDKAIVSFDVFDTLVKRNVSSPEDVFVLLGRIAKDKYGIDGFDTVRNKYAHTVIRKNPYATLHDIYVEIYHDLNNDIVYLLEKEEEKLEIELATCNKFINNAYNELEAEKKIIVAISDMYLSKDVIEKILNKCGYRINNIFVSCECNASKGDGSLFDYVSVILKYDKKKWIHIGDSKKADFLGAKKAGISAYKINTLMPRLDSKQFVRKLFNPYAYKYVSSLVNNNLSNTDTYYYKFGYGLVGNVVFNFTKWLIHKCDQNGIDKVFFFARDGFVLKKAFDSINNGNIESHYLYVSRRSTRVPYLSVKNKVDDIIQTIPPTKLTTLRSVLELFGLDAEAYVEICLKYNYDIEENYLLADLKKSERFKNLIGELREEIICKSYAEYQLFKSYLLQEKFCGKLAVVDIGWNCSMQYYIESLPVIQELNIEMFGYYLGVNDKAKKTDKAEGYISDFKTNNDVISVAAFVGLMESIFLSLEGSTKTYIKKQDAIVGDLLPYEYENDSKERKAFAEIHNGIFDYVSDANELPCIDSYLLNGYDAYLPLKTYGISPRLEDVNMFYDFRYFSEEIVRFADNKNISYYFAHANEFKNNLYKARWKTGFLKRLIKLPLPYYYIFLKLRGKQ